MNTLQDGGSQRSYSWPLESAEIAARRAKTFNVHTSATNEVSKKTNVTHGENECVLTLPHKYIHFPSFYSQQRKVICWIRRDCRKK